MLHYFKNIFISLIQRVKGSHISVNLSSFPVIRHEMFTIYRMGPDYLSYQYIVDIDPLKEIYEEEGIIGPGRYSPEALKNLKEYSNDWFCHHEDERNILAEDLLFLIKKHKMYGAYSLLGSIYNSRDDMTKYFKAGALKGSYQCMACYATMLYLTGNIQDSVYWLIQAAQAGSSHSQMLLAISYNYGTLTPIDLNTAVKYYLECVDDEHYTFYASHNLGAILLHSGYYRTALKYFIKANDFGKQHHEELSDYGDPSNLMSNEQSCKKLLKYPIEERPHHWVWQEFSRKLNEVFTNNQEVFKPVSGEAEVIKALQTPLDVDNLAIEIHPKDMREAKLLQEAKNKQVAPNKHENYVFPVVNIRITNKSIFGTQRELIFIETQYHKGLNTYIKSHLGNLRQTCFDMGYIFNYLPAHTSDVETTNFMISSFCHDHTNPFDKMPVHWEEIEPEEYWKTFLSTEKLPHNCAGFIQYSPDKTNVENVENYKFFLFPISEQTDWPRAFGLFFDMIRRQPIIQVKEEKDSDFGMLPLGSKLVISKDYEIQVLSPNDEKLRTFSMPPLSKILFILMLKHEDGICIKTLSDHRDELYTYYKGIMKDKADMANIDTLVDPTNNSANEKISRIKSAVNTSLKAIYFKDIPLFTPTGKRGESYRIIFDRSRVFYQF